MGKKRFSGEFKKEAVRLMVLDGLSASDVSQKLGSQPSQLYKWQQAHLRELEKDAQAKSQASPKEMAAYLWG